MPKRVEPAQRRRVVFVVIVVILSYPSVMGQAALRPGTDENRFLVLEWSINATEARDP